MLGKKAEPQTQKVLDVDANLQGNLVFKDAVNLQINGNFDGKLETKGELLIGEHAVVKADIVGERITIAGSVTGDVSALSEIRLTGTARLFGNIKTPTLITERGSVFQGNSYMLSSETREAHSRKLFLTLDEVAHYLSVENNLVSEWAENGKLPGAREGKGWRFEKQKVDEWIANGRIV